MANAYPRNYLYLPLNEAVAQRLSQTRSARGRGVVKDLSLESLNALKDTLDKRDGAHPLTEPFMAGKSAVELTYYSETLQPTLITIMRVKSVLELRNKIHAQLKGC